MFTMKSDYGIMDVTNDRNVLVAEYYHLTNEISKLETLIPTVIGEDHEAIVDGISMYCRLRTSIFKKLRSMEGKDTPLAYLNYGKNILYITDEYGNTTMKSVGYNKKVE